MTAPTLVAFGELQSSGVSPFTITTPSSVSWSTGDVVYVFVGSEGFGETIAAPTTTGSGLSLAQQQLHSGSSTDANAGCWGAVATANSSGTFSSTLTRSGATLAVFIAVFVHRGSAGIGQSAISTGSSLTVNLTPIGAHGAIDWVVLDWAAGTVQSFTPTPTTHGAGAPGPQTLSQSAVVTGKFTYYIATLDDQTSAGQVAYGIGGTGTGPFTIIAIEAKASGGTDSGPNYAGAASDLGGGSFAWTNPTNADGAPDSTYATATA